MALPSFGKHPGNHLRGRATRRGAARLYDRPYDPDYQWDDEQIYCSELIAKAVNQAEGTTIFAPRPIGALGPHAELIKKMSSGRLTETTEMVAPVDLVRSPQLERVVDELQER